MGALFPYIGGNIRAIIATSGVAEVDIVIERRKGNNKVVEER